MGLLKNYDATFPPPAMGDPDPLLVKLGLSVKSMSYDIIEAHIKLSYWLRLAWLDTRLYYDGNDMFGSDFNANVSYLPMKVVNGDTPNLWIPDVMSMNSTDAAAQQFGTALPEAFIYARQHVTPDTPYNVLLSRPVQMNAYCRPSLAMFPFDTQICRLHFASWTLNGKYLKMALMAGRGFQSTVVFPDSNEYEWLTDRFGSDFTVVDTGYEAAGSNAWSEVVMSVTLRRLPMYYVVNALLPMLMMVILSSFAFWMPINPAMPGSGERLGYSITCLLTIVAVGLFTADKRPMVGETTWMDRWIAACLVYTTVPVVETVAVFFLDGILRNILEMAGLDNGRVQGGASSQSLTSTSASSKVMKYAQMAADAHEDETMKGKKVMRGVHVVGQHLLCGFVTPRSIDRVFRHCFPVVTMAHFGGLLSEVYSFWHGGKFGLRGSPAIRTLLIPNFTVGLVLTLMALMWIFLALVRWCRGCTAQKKADGGSSDSASEDDDFPALIPNPYLAGSAPGSARRDADADSGCSCQ